MLPPGDWHCPNCTCKFCGLAGEDDAEGDDTTTSALLPCSMCEKKCISLSLSFFVFSLLSFAYRILPTCVSSQSKFLIVAFISTSVDHKLCMQEMDALSDNLTGLVTSFCGRKCQEVSSISWFSQFSFFFFWFWWGGEKKFLVIFYLDRHSIPMQFTLGCIWYEST